MIILFLLLSINFSSIDYLIDKSASVDTLRVLSEDKAILFKMDDNSEEIFSISNRGKLKETMDSSYINVCTTKVRFDTFEEVKKEPIRVRYFLMMTQDSILYNLTWSAANGTLEEASIKLYCLKNILLCPNNECRNKLFSNLK
jgi:hypothetical protein